MSGYYMTRAQQDRILASLASVRYMAMNVSNDVEDEDIDFDPNNLNERLDNLINEVAFVKEYVTHNFLVNKEPREDSTNE